MARRDRKSKNTNIVKVDFTDVESNVLLPEVSGATLKVVAAAFKDNESDGSIVVKYEILRADSKKLIGKTGQSYFNLGDTSLWVLRNFLEALGVEVPAGPLDLDLTELVDLEFVADITQNEYNGRTSNRLANFSMTDGDSKKDEDEDEVIVKGKKRSKDEDEDEDEDEVPKSKKKSRKSDEDEDEEEDEKPRKKSKKLDDEDEEDEAPKKKKKKALITEDEVRDMDEKELKGLVREHELDVDLSEYANIRKKGMAVIDALSDAGLLDAE